MSLLIFLLAGGLVLYGAAANVAGFVLAENDDPINSVDLNGKTVRALKEDRMLLFRKLLWLVQYDRTLKTVRILIKPATLASLSFAYLMLAITVYYSSPSKLESLSGYMTGLIPAGATFVIAVLTWYVRHLKALIKKSTNATLRL